MADSGHPPAELHERLLICRTIKLNAGAHGGHRRCCHAQIQKNAQNKPQIARLILCVHTTLQFYCNLFLTFCPGTKKAPGFRRGPLSCLSNSPVFCVYRSQPQPSIAPLSEEPRGKKESVGNWIFLNSSQGSPVVGTSGSLVGIQKS